MRDASPWSAARSRRRTILESPPDRPARLHADDGPWCSVVATTHRHPVRPAIPDHDDPSMVIRRALRHGVGTPVLWGRTHQESTQMSLVHAFLAKFRRDEDGQGLAEYALILALIAIVAIVALIFLGNQVSTILSKVGSSV
jgi:pilus assembly protein Flp/PilA